MTDEGITTNEEDPVAADIASRNPDTDDIVAGEQVLADDTDRPEPKVAPEPDDFRVENEAATGSTDASAGVSKENLVDETDADRAERHD
jgi:hypothetical protein